VIDLNPACRQVIELVAGVEDDQLAAPTPCSDYRVGDLIDHLDQVSRVFAALARQSAAIPTIGDGPDAGHLEHGWRDVVADHVAVLGAAWSDPAAWQDVADSPAPALPNHVWGKVALTELVVHGWDLATATARSISFPEPTLRACLDHVTLFIPNAPAPALWGPRVDVAPTVGLLDRIVAMTGRRPGPSP
jgi:uncharacterized protein (TIGR03086 family)